MFVRVEWEKVVMTREEVICDFCFYFCCLFRVVCPLLASSGTFLFLYIPGLA